MASNCVGVAGRIRGMLAVSACFFSWDESRITSVDPWAHKMHIPSAALSAANPRVPKLFWMFSHSFSSVFGILMTQRFPPPECLFALNPIPHWKSLFFTVCTQRSEFRYSSRTASLELRWILNPAQGHFSVPDAHWHDSLNKVEWYFQVWIGTPVENDAFCLSKLRFDYFLSLSSVSPCSQCQSPALN